MYNDDDLNAAVSAGIFTEDTAVAFRGLTIQRRHVPKGDLEDFKMVSGLNDIFVSIAIVLTLFAAYRISITVAPILTGCLTAVLSWGLAEYFTKKHRMAFPSIILLAAFTASMALFGWTVADEVNFPPPVARLLHPVGISFPIFLLAGIALSLATVASIAHWWRFKVPVTVAVVTATGLATCVAGSLATFPSLLPWVRHATLAAGLITLGIALWWDSSDQARTTRRSDVAFWLHLAAAPMIVHPIFSFVGLLGSTVEIGSRSLIAVAVYVLLAGLALVIDRRAVLVSALAYLLYAISHLNDIMSANGSFPDSLAVTGAVAGTALLLLSVWWKPIRRAIVRMLPQHIQIHLPYV